MSLSLSSYAYRAATDLSAASDCTLTKFSKANILDATAVFAWFSVPWAVAAMVCESISNIALYVSSSFQTSTSPIRIGFPSLSLTFIGSMFRFLALMDTPFFELNGLNQKKPFCLNVPMYFPKNSITSASFGSSLASPPQQTSAVIMSSTPTAIIHSCPAATVAGSMHNAAPANSISRMTDSIRNPLMTVPLNSFSMIMAFLSSVQIP